MSFTCKFVGIVLVMFSALACAAPRPSAVPNYPAADHLMQFPKADLIVLLELLENPNDNAAALLASNDPEEIGFGIYVASFSCNLDALLAARDLVFDERKTVPRGDFPYNYGHQMDRTEQTVGEYLVRLYRMWFGLNHHTVDQVHAEVTRIAEQGSAWDFAHAWRHRYLVAMSDAERAVILEEVRNIPDDVRPSRYSQQSQIWRRRAAGSRAEALDEIAVHPNEPLRLFAAKLISDSDPDVRNTGVKTILDSLSPQTLQAIHGRTLVYPPDPVYHHNDAGASIYAWYESITRVEP